MWKKINKNKKFFNVDYENNLLWNPQRNKWFPVGFQKVVLLVLLGVKGDLQENKANISETTMLSTYQLVGSQRKVEEKIQQPSSDLELELELELGERSFEEEERSFEGKERSFEEEKVI